ncbi:response regulator [Paenibacillus crassostreae]|uniref:Two-component system response regulator n=1 Tax=Paenibacillus crassostreae TaxID=1763538 RepID=A0A167CEB2_9BACL|nr:response regulator [Paenibacillus crassostreae]AOZ91797.1 DNA-binding response regulator [Paenibacillus crassostreae]OAB73098.1 two-component system response regulator [Paenibacillus crassostreae]
MFNLLIADDEALEREGLELMIRHILPDTFHFLHAENGRKAIQIAEEERPDFIFMDIKMPGIQGLEAVRQISTIVPSTKIVMITAHDYFSYAKEGLALGVRDYLLKPARREEVLQVLQLLISEKEEENRLRNEQLELQEKLSQLIPLAENELTLILMLESVQEVELEQLASLLNLQWVKGYAMVLSFSRQSKKEWEDFQLLKREIYEAVKHFTKPNLSTITGPLVGHQMALFNPLPPGRPGYSQRVNSLDWGERIRCFIEGRFQLSLSVGIGSVREGWDGMSRSYREAVRVCAEDNELLNVRHYDDMTQSSGQTMISLDDEKKLLDALLRHNKQESAERFDSLFAILEGTVASSFSTLRGEVIGLLLFLCRGIQSGDGADLITSLSVVEDRDALRKSALLWIDSFIDGLREEREQSRSLVLQRALLYIDQKYKEDISLEQSAEYVNLSPHYFSKLFKQHVGENFIDFVTRLRIKEAKLLIVGERLSLKEICYEVGYKDPNYFSRVFKKATGITPSEYRQQLVKKSPC